MKRPKVYITGGEDAGWAIDEDLRLAAQALESFVDLVPLAEADIVHAVYWYGLLGEDMAAFAGKRILCHIPGEPFRYLADPQHTAAMRVVGRWITRTEQARTEMREISVETALVPYLVDVDVFKPLPEEDPDMGALRKKWNIPENTYLIGSFQRDTEGADLTSPKLVKGPDILLEILIQLKEKGRAFYVVLAGPRRNWIIRELERHEISYTYLGRATEGDDLRVNTLPREELNLVYNLLDLYIVASRSEGGPHAILEAAASGCKVISTPVGMAPETLEPKCVYRHPAQAVDIILKDMDEGYLIDSVETHRRRALEKHTPAAVIHLLKGIYEGIDAVPVYSGYEPRRARTYAATPKAANQIKVCLWHSFFKPPYGGGNQFMMGLRKSLLAKGVEVVENILDESVDAYVLNSIHFDVERFLEFSKRGRLNVLHRIDGPISLIRGYDLEKDELCYELNAKFASATVLQSAWVYKRITDLTYSPVSPTIIHNGVDTDIFHARGKRPLGEGKVRLISTSWSNNERKGGPVYKWIEQNLDWNKYEYTFVGNASEEFEHIRHIPPVPSEELADLLREHDIYITASRNDPCSNALIEALACGLPALYYDDGGHPELVSYGGLPFSVQEEIPGRLESLVSHYGSFQRLITVAGMDAVAEKYLHIIRKIIS